MRGSSSTTAGVRRVRRRASDDGKRSRSWKELRTPLANVLGVDLPENAFPDAQPIDDASSTAALLRTLLKRRILPLRTRLSSDQLAEVLGLHRNTISKVFQILADEGYLHRRQGMPALVVAHSQVLPTRQTERVSHTLLASKHNLHIRTVEVRSKEEALADLEREKQVAAALKLRDEEALVTVYSRIREMCVPGGSWIPVIAETAYFIDSLPQEFYTRLFADEPVESLHAELREHGIEPVTGEYKVRIDRLPSSFTESWARSSGLGAEAIAALRFLRFESTTHGGHRGPIEYSVAFLAEGFFALSTADLTLAIDRDAFLASPQQVEAAPADPRRQARKSVPRR